MKNKVLIFLCVCFTAFSLNAGQWIRINQLGYLPKSVKVAVFISEDSADVANFELVDAMTGKTVRDFSSVRNTGSYGTMKSTYRLNFSSFEKRGSYYLKAGEAVSPVFPINADVYNGTADFALNYMRQQRCGYNPFLRDSCHRYDGYVEYHPTKSGQRIDVRGGWHDAGDYLQYTTTSANAMYQMMLAYQENPESFGDYYDAMGNKGANGIPDIVDEIKWGLDWLDRMNPEKGEFYNQIADDRDHASFRSPVTDKVDYGYGPGTGRPVYFCSGEPQQRGKFKNATTGVASTTGKFASCFAMGARVLKPFYPEFAEKIREKAADAYQTGVEKPGVCQTASVASSYIYEEVNWVDDMELGAVELYKLTGDKKYLDAAVEYGRQEPMTPWMGADSARHYQWYPFLNVGHFQIASVAGNERLSDEFIRNMRSGISRTYEKAVGNPYLFGIPAIWCSNNLTTAMVTQCMLYRKLTGDSSYVEMEAALRDWLFGCNPWGTSMVVELPRGGDYPSQPHSAYVAEHLGNATGGLVDGPVYSSIFNSLRGIALSGLPWAEPEDYARFQPFDMVYHDAIGDYSTNEPTMDGTASMTYFLSSLQSEGMRQAGTVDRNLYYSGGIVRTDPSEKTISLVFTAHKDAEGADAVLKVLDKYGVKANFFFTGDFFENKGKIVERILKRGDYVGSHSYGHLQYIDWKHPEDTTYVTKDEFMSDIRKCYEVMGKYGITLDNARYFMPPFEEYNSTVASWADEMGLQLVNYTPGTGSSMDYTTPDLEFYRGSKEIYGNIMKEESENGLNGHILLLHLGTDKKRTDKFYDSYLDKLVKTLLSKGYRFTSLAEAVGF